MCADLLNNFWKLYTITMWLTLSPLADSFPTDWLSLVSLLSCGKGEKELRCVVFIISVAPNECVGFLVNCSVNTFCPFCLCGVAWTPRHAFFALAVEFG